MHIFGHTVAMQESGLHLAHDLPKCYRNPLLEPLSIKSSWKLKIAKTTVGDVFSLVHAHQDPALYFLRAGLISDVLEIKVVHWNSVFSHPFSYSMAPILWFL